MSTYFVNANGTDTSPYDTEAKGATTIRNLFDNITEANGDIIEVSDDGGIIDYGSSATMITAGVTFRSYAGNIGKASISLNNASAFGFGDFTAPGTFKFQQLKIFKAGPNANFNIIELNDNPSGYYVSPEITDCELYVADTTGLINVIGIVFYGPVTFTGDFLIERNKIYNVNTPIFMDEGGGM